MTTLFGLLGVLSFKSYCHHYEDKIKDIFSDLSIGGGNRRNRYSYNSMS